MSSEFITALASTLYPYPVPGDPGSELASPLDDFKPFPGSDSMVLVKGADQTSTGSTLTKHPANKFVMDFLRMIVVDSLSLQQSSKSAPVIDLVLEAAPE